MSKRKFWAIKSSIRTSVLGRFLIGKDDLNFDSEMRFKVLVFAIVVSSVIVYGKHLNKSFEETQMTSKILFALIRI